MESKENNGEAQSFRLKESKNSVYEDLLEQMAFLLYQVGYLLSISIAKQTFLYSATTA